MRRCGLFANQNFFDFINGKTLKIIHKGFLDKQQTKKAPTKCNSCIYVYDLHLFIYLVFLFIYLF